eukprot:Blabericola_migrator_1__6559@NODE_3304_length_1877_cov_141_476796_g2065_i0_p1_GENE_NODE_3304_length_1877_cov_141_476796_g2065_i0NODE_3304_length_1877_cov_141_476796_g2065_i0_p1_ORF_typecomplete_len249_score32_28D123/PF07065_14/5_7e06Treacle/PF03546_14/2_1_NODE_3304_length_1877_cov_141_476796_g2065_i0178924
MMEKMEGWLCPGHKEGSLDGGAKATDVDSQSSTDSDESSSSEEEVPPDVKVMAELVSHAAERNDQVFLPKVCSFLKGCRNSSCWYPFHLTFKSPFPFESGYSLWRVFVMFSRPVAACPVNVNESCTELERSSLAVHILRSCIQRKTNEVEIMWGKQRNLFAQSFLPVRRYVLELWIGQGDIWTERVHPFHKRLSPGLFSWSEIRKLGIFNNTQELPVIRMAETPDSKNKAADEFARLFARNGSLRQEV